MFTRITVQGRSQKGEEHMFSGTCLEIFKTRQIKDDNHENDDANQFISNIYKCYIYTSVIVYKTLILNYNK